MATYSRILTQKIPWVEESGGLQTIGSQTVGHDRANKAQQLPFRHSLAPPSSMPSVLDSGWSSILPEASTSPCL